MHHLETANEPAMDAEENPLSRLAISLLRDGTPFTDIHVASDLPAMIRRSTADWSVARDSLGNPVVIKDKAIREFLSGVYGEPTEQESRGQVPQWCDALAAAGSLHPATTLCESDGTSIASWRVRCTVQMQMMGEAIGLVLRPLPPIPESVESLGLPIQVSQLLHNSSSGLIVVSGPTGSGKSTTLAAMINEINTDRCANILTIEDPVEFIHDRKRSIVNQRELGVDVMSYEAGVRDALRFVPDVILIGEIRDAATMRAAVRAGESGHLVLSTMHAATAVTAIQKMLAYSENSLAESRALASCLVGVVAQALIRDIDGQRNHLAYEVLSCRHPKVMDTIAASASDTTGRPFAELETLIREGQLGNATIPMFSSLESLVLAGSVDPRVAANVAWHQSDKATLLNIQNGRRGLRKSGSALTNP